MINGNITGVKKYILQRLRELYKKEIPKEILVSEDILTEIAALSQLLNREISIYINRRGRIVDVSVGDSTTVNLREWNEKRGDRGLSGVRCVHTHPSGQPELSDVDLSALRLLRLDAMVSCGVSEGRPGKIFLAYINSWGKDQLAQVTTVGPLDPQQVYHNSIMLTILATEKDLANTKTYKEHLPSEKAMLIGLFSAEEDEALIKASMDELTQLADTAGVTVMGSYVQNRDKPDAKYFIGSGKAQEIALARQVHDINVIIFNHDLSPVQQRNLEDLMGCKVIDRTELILDIFAQRAQTKEGKLQVELAQLNYLLPRLIGQGMSLSRLGGGIGTRGPGETKLEVDRRRIRKKITDLQREIGGVRKVRNLQRNRRQSIPLPAVALVGYTNAGKSTLLNILTKADVLAENKLFATLDPTTRRLDLPDSRSVLLSDTVGFIDKIPHHLVAAFRATLEEVTAADLLIHVVDASHPQWELQMESVNKVLASLNAVNKPTIIALNKADRISGLELACWEKKYANSCAISALKGTGFEHLFSLIDLLLPMQTVRVGLKIPYKSGQLIGLIHKLGNVLKEEYLEEIIFLEVELDEISLAKINKSLEQGENS